jgi:transposase
MSQRRRFSREFKLSAVRKVVEQGLSNAQVARDLAIDDKLLRDWRKALQAELGLSAHAVSSSTVEAELKRLRDENRELKIERDILKKAAVYFARESK